MPRCHGTYQFKTPIQTKLYVPSVYDNTCEVLCALQALPQSEGDTIPPILPLSLNFVLLSF